MTQHDRIALPDIEQVPLDRLFLSEINPRSQVEDSHIDRLADSIRAHGLVHNLAGLREAGGRVGIVSGGCRFRAIRKLAAEGLFATVPVKITEDPEEAAIWAASANHLIEPVPAADEIVEYRAMQGRGASLAEIALAFGQSEAHVRRRLALAGLPDDAIAALRAGEITLEHAKILTLAQDASRIAEALDGLRAGRLSEYSLRRFVVPEAVGETDRRARFVGLDAYAAAGGRIAHDLFEDRRHLTDPALLDRLAAEKLDAAAAAMVAGGAWAWVETCAEAHVSWAEIEKGLAARVYPVEGDLTEAEAERYAELAELANADVLDAEGQADLDALSRTLDGDYTAEQRAVAGAILAIDYDGEMRLHGGLIRKADREAAIAAGVIAPARGGAGEDAEPASPAFSARLTADLEAVARAARQHAVLAKPDLLLDLLAFQLSGRVGHRAIFALRHGDVANAPGTATGFAPDARIAAARHAPADPWTADRARAFRAFRKTGKARVRGDLAQYLAQLLDLPDSALGRLIDKEAKTAIRAIWAPTAENFFTRVKGAYLDTLWREMLGLPDTHPTVTTFARLKKRAKDDINGPPPAPPPHPTTNLTNGLM
jgi:ParB family chromosome partitioning protein